MTRLRRPGYLLGALVLGSTLVRFAAARGIHTPWIMPDEVIYGELGKSLYHSGRFEVLGEHIGFFGLVVPALVGGPLSVSDLERGYHWLKLLQALVMSLTAVPVYLWARSLAGPRWAFVAAALTVAIPGLAYSGLVMTEVAFYPVLVLAAWAMARALERATPRRQGWLVAACALAAMTRLQAFVLLPVFVTAAALKAAFDRRPREALRLWPAAAGLVALAALWAAWRLAGGAPLSAVFGAYAPAGESHYDVAEALRFALYHLGDELLFTGIFPLCAVALLLAVRERSRALDAYLATVIALSFWLTLEVGVFASTHVGYLAERNLLPLAPILFIGLAAWLHLGAPRPALPTIAVCGAALALVIAMPVGRLVSPDAFPNSFTMQPLIEYEQHHPSANLDLLLTVVAAVALACFATAPRRLLVLLPTMLAILFVWTSVSSSREIVRLASFLQTISTGPQRRWIDVRADGPAAYVYIGEQNWPVVWENVFWNRRVRHVYDVEGTSIPGGMPQEQIAPRDDGLLLTAGGRPARGRYVVAQYPLAFVGQAIASAGDGLVLWRLDPPFRLSVWTQRVAGHVRVLAYGCRGGSLRLKLQGPLPEDVQLRRNDAPYAHVRLDAAGRWSGSIPAKPPRPNGLCTFDVLTAPAVTAPTVVFRR
ncbi:MAG: hypothetical protein QOG81_1687 [Gaiellaceae bacterium]|nr:hypothetical protein [Gaiellaceae bacterium]